MHSAFFQIQLQLDSSKIPWPRDLGRLPVVTFAAGGIATPADVALMMQLGVCFGVSYSLTSGLCRWMGVLLGPASSSPAIPKRVQRLWWMPAPISMIPRFAPAPSCFNVFEQRVLPHFDQSNLNLKKFQRDFRFLFFQFLDSTITHAQGHCPLPEICGNS